MNIVQYAVKGKVRKIKVNSTKMKNYSPLLVGMFFIKVALWIILLKRQNRFLMRIIIGWEMIIISFQSVLIVITIYFKNLGKRQIHYKTGIIKEITKGTRRWSGKKKTILRYQRIQADLRNKLMSKLYKKCYEMRVARILLINKIHQKLNRIGIAFRSNMMIKLYQKC